MRGEATEVRPSFIQGRGLFAAKAIAKDTYLGEYEGRQEHYVVGSHIGRWTMGVQHGDGSVELRNARFDGNDLRYINHSQNPNVYAKGFKFYALLHIEPNEELVLDYGSLWHPEQAIQG